MPHPAQAQRKAEKKEEKRASFARESAFEAIAEQDEEVHLAEVVFPNNGAELLTSEVAQPKYIDVQVTLDSGAGAHVCRPEVSRIEI